MDTSRLVDKKRHESPPCPDLDYDRTDRSGFTCCIFYKYLVTEFVMITEKERMNLLWILLMLLLVLAPLLGLIGK
jgi:hypothetical protein